MNSINSLDILETENLNLIENYCALFLNLFSMKTFMDGLGHVVLIANSFVHVS